VMTTRVCVFDDEEEDENPVAVVDSTGQA
jgi:hypothetical protein